VAGGIAVLRIDGDAALAGLHERLGAVLTTPGSPSIARPFAPHVTLARKAAKAEPPRERPAFEWRANGFALVESLPGGSARYEVLSGFGGALRRAATSIPGDGPCTTLRRRNAREP
jgi:2'-5' RNA ligase